MKLQIGNYYDDYWKWVKKLPPSTYERDSVFPKIFRKGESVLDLACGNGDSSLQIAKLTQKEVSGLDISKVAVDEANKKGIKAKVANVEDVLPFKTGEFDTVFWGDNIEHIFFPEKAIAEIRRILKPRGRLIISTPNMAYWRYRVGYLLTGRIPDTEFNGKPPWAWSHIRFFNIKILNSFLNANGFKMVRIWGINRRKLDKWFVKLFPNFCGMILVVEAVKK
jgi:methionine biosynthesis protein MetW